MMNIIGVPLAEKISLGAFHRYGDPHSALAYYTVPWALREEQLALFVSAALWSVIGLAGQLIYNLGKKPPMKFATTLIVVFSLLACTGICTGVVYATQGDRDMPTRPMVFPAGPPVPAGGETIASYKVEPICLLPDSDYWSSHPILAGRVFVLTAHLRNTGPQAGIAEVDLRIDGKVFRSAKVSLVPLGTGSVRFTVIIPRAGTYAITVGGLTETFSIVEP